MSFKIDFFELSFLAEACIPPRPIARTMFWHNMIDKYYHELTEEQRARLHEWMNRNDYYKDGLRLENEDCLVFEARYNPDNQYIATTNHDGKVTEHECFLLNDRYYTKRNTYLIEERIESYRQQRL